MSAIVRRITSYSLFSLILSLLLLLVAVWLPRAAALSAQETQPLPTAAACEPPTAHARGGANARQGPTPDYDLVEQLAPGSVRRVIGRHAGFRWWQIETSGGGVGWVWDSAVIVTGDVLAVPLVEAPPLDGTIPATDAVWDLSGAGICLPTPTTTPGIATATPLAAAADWEYADEGWEPPLNLSNAGAAVAPQLLTLGADLLLIWEDTVDGFAFSRRQNGAWTPPRIAEFPFSTRRYETQLAASAPTPRYTPQLLARTENDVYAFWRDDENNLYASHVAAAAFADYTAWTARQQLGTAVAGMAAVVDTRGAIHLAYLQTADLDGAPSGLYVRRLEVNAASWSAPAPLHLSGYYRLPTAATANLRMATAGSTVLVSWVESAQERIWLARSPDGGESWDDLQLLDSRQVDDSITAVSPGDVHLLATDSQLHLTWQAGHEGSVCSQYHQWSEDGGVTWQPATQLDAAQPGAGTGCLQDVMLLAGDETVILAGNAVDNAYHYLWQGGDWTEAQSQQPLRGFTLGTTGRPVSLNCGRDAVVQGSQLMVAACGESIGQDIWFLSQDLETSAATLAVTPVWSTPAPLSAQTPATDGAVMATTAFASPSLVADDEGRLHAFWTEAVSSGAAAEMVPGQISHAVWQNGAWSRPQPLFSASGGKVAQPAAVLTRAGRLVLLWSGGSSGTISFSWAAAARAMIASEWTEPAPLPAPVSAGSAPTIAADPVTGDLYAAYAVPLNEERGIYLTTSANGEIWSDATLVFDAAEAGWARADQPQLVISGTGELHLLFWKRALPDNAPAAELYYTRSRDGGATWSEAAAIHNGTPNTGVVVWSDLAVAGGRLIHFAWQEWDPATGARTLWHRLSEDGGLTWNPAARIGGFGQEIGAAVLLQDPAERPFILALTDRASAAVGATEPQLAQWQWSDEGQRWEQAESLALRAPAPAAGQALAATITGEGDLVALLVAGTESGAPQLISAVRAVALPAVLPTPLPTLTPTPQSTAAPSPTARPQPTPTLVFSTNPETGSSGPLSFLPDLGGNAMIAGAILALIPATLLVVLAVAVFGRVRAGRR